MWEEVIIHLPADVRLVCLSATVSNADELADWITTVRGPTEAVIEERRPVELAEPLPGRRQGLARTSHLLPDAGRRPAQPRGRPARRRGAARPRQPSRGPAAPALLHARGGSRWSSACTTSDLLPAIYFIFSRAGVRRRA